LECVINVSDGRSSATLAALARAAGRTLLDRHSDADHNRSVFTLAGPAEAVEEGARNLARAVIETVDLTHHRGVHPRIGSLDVVPFTALDRAPDGRLADGSMDEAVRARDRFAAWAADELLLPCFEYGDDRPLPEVRRRAWHDLAPDTGPDRPHPTAGAVAVGARRVLVAYNLWLTAGDEPAAEPAAAAEPGPADAAAAGTATAAAARAAAAVRRPGLRTLGLAVAGGAQVSCNLVDPWHLGPGAVHDLVAAHLPPTVAIARAELVGLLPAAVLDAEPEARWSELDLDRRRTIEARLERAGLDGGSG
jgi:hypothetical protein